MSVNSSTFAALGTIIVRNPLIVAAATTCVLAAGKSVGLFSERTFLQAASVGFGQYILRTAWDFYHKPKENMNWTYYAVTSLAVGAIVNGLSSAICCTEFSLSCNVLLVVAGTAASAAADVFLFKIPKIKESSQRQPQTVSPIVKN